MSNTVRLHFDDTALKNSSYHPCTSQEVDGRIISRYLLSDEDAFESAAKTIQDFVKNNNNLTPLFSVEQDKLIPEIQERKYLVINGPVVCFSKKWFVPAYRDKYFSEDLLEEPITCTHRHHLEKKLAEIWVIKKGDICPAGNHLIGNIIINESYKQKVVDHINNEKKSDETDWLKIVQELRKENKTLKMKTQNSEEKTQDNEEKKLDETDWLKIVLELQKENETLKMKTQDNEEKPQNNEEKTVTLESIAKKIKKHDPILISTSVVKVGAKIAFISIGGKQLFKIVNKDIAKLTMQKSFGFLGKKIPIISIFVGLTLGAYRLYKGESGKAILEVASGALATIPFYGTIASIGIDLAMMSHDVYQLVKENEKEDTMAINLELSEAYKFLSLDKNSNPTKAEVDAAYRQQITYLHPDHKTNLEIAEYNVQATELTQTLNLLKDLIYQQRGWE